MESRNTLLQSEIEDSLATIAAQQGNEIVSRIKPILMNNITRKRLDAFLEGDPKYLGEYIQNIIQKYKLLHGYLHALQGDRDNEEWNLLSKKLSKYAYAFLRRKNFDASIQTHEIAEDCASRAAEAILNADFSYDTDFDAWVVKIVHNKCLKFMSEEMQKRKIPAQKQVELNEEIEIGDDKPDVLHQLEEEELRSNINNALTQISKGRREAIVLKYFEDLSPTEISERLGKSVDAVYCLQFNGLRDLRKILDQNRNIL
jgi:RNA polymerase sigma factor (sigma-70 family)